MKFKTSILILGCTFSFLYKASCQIIYDTIVINEGRYEKLNFKVGNDAFQVFEVNKVDLDINNGEILSFKKNTDTIAIRHDTDKDVYEIRLSDKTWKQSLFGKYCSYLGNEVNFPHLFLKRNKHSNALVFENTDVIGQFVKRNYLNRLECIKGLEDQYMKKHIEKWIDKIDNDSINEFTSSFAFHFTQIISLYDLVVPQEVSDTIVCKISARNAKTPFEYSYKTYKTIESDSFISYNYTDKVGESNMFRKQIAERLYEPFDKYYTIEQQNINEIIIESIRDEERMKITLTQEGYLQRYLKVIQYYNLDKELKTKYTFYNYEINRIYDSNNKFGKFDD